MLKEFREFALKGNMVDLAIGVIIGATFAGLVQSVVNDLLMPLISGIMTSAMMRSGFSVIAAMSASLTRSITIA